MLEISEGQQAQLNLIQEVLGIDFNGKTNKELDDFIEYYLKEVYDFINVLSDSYSEKDNNKNDEYYY